MKATVKVHQYPTGGLAIFHGRRCLGRYDSKRAQIDVPTTDSNENTRSVPSGREDRAVLATVKDASRRSAVASPKTRPSLTAPPHDARSLRPPDLVIQDELHLISGPLGSMTGLYETALDALCARTVDGKEIHPKIVASTATVRRAEKQIKALFGRPGVQVFPPPGPDRRDSFFAKGLPDNDPGGRLYLGLAAPGISPRVTFLRGIVTLMSAAEYAWDAWGGLPADNPADPYMTLIAYFNALRELGAARRLVEEQVRSRLQLYGQRKRVGEADAGLASRTISYEPEELTSRIATGQVSQSKDRLAAGFRGYETASRCCACDEHDLGRVGYRAAGPDGSHRAAKNGGGIHSVYESRWKVGNTPRTDHCVVEYGEAAGPFAF